MIVKSSRTSVEPLFEAPEDTQNCCALSHEIQNICLKFAEAHRGISPSPAALQQPGPRGPACNRHVGYV